jgi:tetratricopeptide (TPR) repeat protein
MEDVMKAMITLMAAGVMGMLSVGAPPQQAQDAPRLRPVAKAQNPQPAETAAQVPFTLSDPDGQELILEDLSARAAVHGMLSLTEIELRFRNPQSHRIEGRFNCVLPPNAAISRFAKEVNGTLMEGEVVERLRANQVYEQFLHQMRDPALLEQDQGNRFSARIFPIEANASVRILVSYSALLPLRNGVRTFSFPMRGLPKVNHLTFRALVQALPGEEQVGGSKSSISGGESMTHSTAEVISMDERDFVPQHDVELAWRPSGGASRRRVLRAGDFYLASYRPELPPPAVAAPHSWLLCVDTSASSAEGAPHRIKALETMLAAMPADDRVQVDAFDQDIATLGSGTAAELSRSIGSLLRARLFLGGTDLAALLRHAGKFATEHPDRGVILASDLVATLGETERRDVESAARTFPARTPLHALILGSREDAPIAKALTAGRGRVIRVPFTESLEARAREAASSLAIPLGASLDVTDSAAEWVYPPRVDDVQSGDEVIVIGKTRPTMNPNVRLGGQAILPVQGQADDGQAGLPVLQLDASSFGPLLEREGWRAYLDYLADREAAEGSAGVRQALATEQVKISVEQRVVIPRTTMLVLESEWDYQRFGLDRRALAGILTIGAGGIERLDRKTSAPPLPVPVQKQNVSTMPDAPAREGEGRVAAVPAMDAAKSSAVAEAITVTAAAPTIVETTSVQTTIANGAFPGGMPPGPQTTIAPAAPLDAQPAVAPPEPRRDERPAPAVAQSAAAPHSDAAWRKRIVPSKEEIEQLQAKLKATPSDRGLYNQLAEALAAAGEWSALRRVALDWQPYDPENPQVYEVLGLADEHLGNMAEAARANASIIEVAPGKTELLQRAGLLLLRDGRAALAEAPLRHALEVRPDRANGYRHLALLLWRQGRNEEAARLLESATEKTFPAWYGDVQRVIHEELGYVYRSWIAAEPNRRNEISDRAHDHAVDLTRRDALRVTLAWETDANDVDLHVIDPKGEECYYSHRATASGLSLYQDITQGLGPEVVRTEKLEKGLYDIGVRYFSAGPMGVSRGIIVVIRDDRSAAPSVEITPFRLIEGGGDIRYVTQVAVK